MSVIIKNSDPNLEKMPIFGPHWCVCDKPAVIWMRSYAKNNNDLWLCSDCALQLVRKLSEDLCEVLTKAGRNG
jgi:hypothetical protein